MRKKFLIKISNFFSTKDTISKIEGQVIVWEKIYLQQRITSR